MDRRRAPRRLSLIVHTLALGAALFAAAPVVAQFVCPTNHADSPGSPGNVTATPGNRQVTVSWSAGTNAISYMLRRKLSSASTWGDPSGVNDTSKTFSPLINGTGYDFQVASLRSISTSPWQVCSPWSGTVSATPVPPVPTITSASLTSTPINDTDDDDAPDTYGRNETIEVTVTWDKNVTWNVTAGTVRVQLAIGTGTKYATLVTGGVTSGSAKSLTFRYTVEADVTDSDGIFVKVVSGQTVFAANGATLKDQYGQNANLNHPVTQSPNAGHKVDGSLVDDTAPTLSSARVIGATLTLTFDETLKAVTPANGAFTISGATGNPTVTAITMAGSTVTLSLSAAVGDSDTGITVSYDAASSGSTPLQDRVANQVASFSGHSVHTVPLAPRLPQPTVGGTPISAAVTLTWESDSNGGSAITEWQYRQSTDGVLDDESWMPIAASGAATTTYAVTGLTYATAYRFAVRAVNAVGAGHSSNEVDVTPALPPAPILTAIPGNREVELTWESYGAGFTIAGWQYRQRTLDVTTWDPDWTDIPTSDPATTTHTVTGLTNGTAYLFQVRACTSTGQNGCHVESVAASTTPSAGEPSKQPVLSAIPGNREATLSWGSYDAGVAVNSWQYRQRTLDDATWNPDWTAIPGSDQDTSTHAVTGLANGTTYLFQVRGCAPAGQDGTPNCHVESVAASTTPSAGEPSKQPVLSAIPGNREATLSWGSYDAGVAVNSWQYRQRTLDDATWNPDWTAIPGSDQDTSTHAVTGLANGTTYLFQVRGCAPAGQDGTPNCHVESVAASTTPSSPTPTAGAPSDQPVLSAIPGDRRVTLTWGSYSAGTSVSSWQHRQRTLEVTTWDPDWTDIPASDPATATHSVTGLTNGTTYLFQVRGCAATGQNGALNCLTPSVIASAAPSAPGGIHDLAPSFDGAAVAALTLSEGTPMEQMILPAANGGNGALTYALTSVPTGLAGLEFDTAARTLSGTPTHSGSFTLTYLAEDADANRSAADTAALHFRMTVNENAMTQRKATLQSALSAMGRRALASSVSNIGTRFSARGQTESSLVLAGHPIPPAGARPCPVEWGGYIRFPCKELIVHDHDAVHRSPRHVSADELLAGSAFDWMVDTSAANDDVGKATPAPRWSVWGRGELLDFAGRPEPEVSYEGEARRGYLGIDAQFGAWLAGIAVSHGWSATAYRFGAGEGRMETTVTSLHPYGRWRPGAGIEVWTILGAGWGDAVHAPDSSPQGNGGKESDSLMLRTAAVGVRQALPSIAGLDLALRGEGGIAHVETNAGSEAVAVAGLHATGWRVLAALETSARLALAAGSALTPFVEVAGRYDGGDGETGVGLVLNGGLRYGGPHVKLEARGGLVALHSAEAYREHGLSLDMRVSPKADGRGLSLSIAPRWGAPTGETEALWNERLPRADASGVATMSIDARLGYGVSIPGTKGVVTPFGETSAAGGSRRVRVGIGYRLETATVELAGERLMGVDAEPEDRASLKLNLTL